VAQYLRREGHLEGLQLGRQESLQKGIYEVAKKVVLMGWDIATIHDITQLPNSKMQPLEELV
jgi:hypothetical protein